MKPKLTVILPSIRPDKWEFLYNQIQDSCNRHDFEVIAIGPNLPINDALNSKLNFKFIREFGSPARSVQVASVLADGKYVTWMPDDCYAEVGAYSDCIDFMETKSEKDGMTVLYSEGPNFSGTQHLQPEYWVARTHADQRLAGIKDGWKCAPCFMYRTELYRKLGGLDCRFEHINMNTHDLAFRVQNLGGVIHYSPRRVLKLDWIPWNNVNKTPVQLAYELNDAPLFRQLYDTTEPRPTHIDYDNWREDEPYWNRKYQQ